VAWIGAGATCAAYPQADVFFHPPAGYRGGVGTDSAFVADTTTAPAGGCPAQATAGPGPWTRYRTGTA
jgi:hypothetical protein